MVAGHRLVERLAHAVQALELEARPASPAISMMVATVSALWRGELRVEARPRREQPAGAGEIGLVGRGLAGEHRIVGEPALLRRA